jgi:hypothetical protein
MVIVGVPLICWGLYLMWRDHQYDEYYKTHAHDEA